VFVFDNFLERDDVRGNDVWMRRSRGML
jgi:hypothetical protein